MADSLTFMQEETGKTKAAEEVDSPAHMDQEAPVKKETRLAEEEMKAGDQLAAKEKEDGDHGKERPNRVGDDAKATEELAEKEKEVRVLINSVKDRVPADKIRDLMALPAATVRFAARKILELTIDVPDWARADAELVAEIEKSSVADQWTRIMKDAETEGNFVWCPLVVVAELPLAEQAKAQKLVPWLCWKFFL